MNPLDDTGFLWLLYGFLVFGAIVYLAESFSWDMDLRRNHRPLYDKRWQDGSVGAIAFMLEPLLELWDWVKRKRLGQEEEEEKSVSWQERVKAYRNAGGSAERLADDNAARKIVKGLGWPERHIDTFCRCLGIEPAEDASQLDKALDILDRVSGGLFSETSPTRKFIVSRRKVAFSDAFWQGNVAAQLLQMARNVEGGMVIFHMKASDSAQHRNLAIIILHEAQTCVDGLVVPEWLLKSPATFKLSRDGMDIWVKDTEDLIRDMAGTLDWYIPDVGDALS